MLSSSGNPELQIVLDSTHTHASPYPRPWSWT